MPPGYMASCNSIQRSSFTNAICCTQECFDQRMGNIPERGTFRLKKRPDEKGMLINLDNTRITIAISSGHMQPTLLKHWPELGVWSIITGTILFGYFGHSVDSSNA